MGPMVIVIVTPGRDQFPGVAQVGEQVLVEALVHRLAGHSAGMSREGRRRPLKFSTKPFCMGFPGAM